MTQAHRVATGLSDIEDLQTTINEAERRRDSSKASKNKDEFKKWKDLAADLRAEKIIRANEAEAAKQPPVATEPPVGASEAPKGVKAKEAGETPVIEPKANEPTAATTAQPSKTTQATGPQTATTTGTQPEAVKEAAPAGQEVAPQLTEVETKVAKLRQGQ